MWPKDPSTPTTKRRQWRCFVCRLTILRCEPIKFIGSPLRMTIIYLVRNGLLACVKLVHMKIGDVKIQPNVREWFHCIDHGLVRWDPAG